MHFFDIKELLDNKINKESDDIIDFFFKHIKIYSYFLTKESFEFISIKEKKGFEFPNNYDLKITLDSGYIHGFFNENEQNFNFILFNCDHSNIATWKHSINDKNVNSLIINNPVLLLKHAQTFIKIIEKIKV